MTLTITDIDDKDVPELVALWNHQLTVPNTIWRFSKELDEETLSRIRARSKVVILKSDGHPIGFGIWHDRAMVGISAPTPDDFYAVLRFIAEDQAGKDLFLVTNGAESYEMDWIVRLGIQMDIKVEGYKPMTTEEMAGHTRSEQLASRKPWIRRLTASYDHVKEMIDAEVSTK